MKRIIVLLVSILLAGICLFFIILKNKNLENNIETVIFNQNFCGTKSLFEEASEGKQVFYANCAACHKLDKKMTGPALRDIAQKYDTITIQEYLRGRKTIIKSKGYNSSCLIFRTLTDKDISNILSYTH